MSWIPDPPIILVLLQNIEKEENLLQDSSELFWRFYLQCMSPDEFKERTEFWINRQQKTLVHSVQSMSQKLIKCD